MPASAWYSACAGEAAVLLELKGELITGLMVPEGCVTAGHAQHHAMEAVQCMSSAAGLAALQK